MTSSGSENPPTILIADDYDDNRELLRLLLVGANYEVREARNGTECLAMALERPPDLILVDLSMPEMDGWRVFTELRKNPQTERVPCMAVTASEIDRARALEVGFSGYLSKPFRSNELYDIVAQLLAQAGHALNAGSESAKGA